VSTTGSAQSEPTLDTPPCGCVALASVITSGVVAIATSGWTVRREQAAYGPDPEAGGHVGFECVRMPEPAVTDRATIAAYLAAFDSDNIPDLYRAWRSTVTAIDNEEDSLRLTR
jgi:hypothetical protein